MEGTKSNDPVSYVYREDEDNFFEVMGLLPARNNRLSQCSVEAAQIGN